MKRSITVALSAILCLAALTAEASAEEQWLRCTLAQDIVTKTSGKETTKPLSGSSVIFIIRDDNFFTYGADTKALTKLQANVSAREVTFYDGPLSDTISRVTGTFTVVESAYHEAHGTCTPIDPITTDQPKF